MEITIPLAHATEHQLLVETYQLVYAMGLRVDQINARLTSMEMQMSELTEATTALKAAVDGVAQRLLPLVQDLEAANASLSEALTAAQADDAAAEAAMAEAKAATAAVRTEVDRLNALGSDPATPVDPEPEEPVEPPTVEVPADPDAEG